MVSEPRFDLQGKRIFVAGHNGLVGGALVRRLDGIASQILTVDRAELDLRDQRGVVEWMKTVRPEVVFLAAATVGGIHANSTRPADFLYDNAAIAMNVIDAARRVGVAKFVNLGSACIYPRAADQPIQSESLLTGPLEPTNEWYAIAKIAAVKLCDAFRAQYGLDFISVMPTNIYGPGDNFDTDQGHVLPALIQRFHRSKVEDHAEISIWGTGTPVREFLYVDDAADGIVFLAERYAEPGPINLGSGESVTIRRLAETIRDVVGFEGSLVFDTSKPDGMPIKSLDSREVLSMGWRAQVSLREGIERTYAWYTSELERGQAIRGVA